MRFDCFLFFKLFLQFYVFSFIFVLEISPSFLMFLLCILLIVWCFIILLPFWLLLIVVLRKLQHQTLKL